MSLYYSFSIAFFLLVLSNTACNQTSKTEQRPEEKFKPTGGLSDLVRSPVRADGSIDSTFLPIFQWTEQEYDFGVIQEGDIIEREFTFKNAGTAPLLITKATSTCGCTIPEWPKEPIPPGEWGVIHVKFNSLSRLGTQIKEVTIFANTYPNQSIIRLKGRVEPNP